MTKQDAPTTTDAERADYEKWVLTERPSLLKNTTCLGGDQVEIHVDQIAWIAYQAGASSRAARASSAAAQWLPIAGAPKDGSEILLGRAESEELDSPGISVPGYWQEGYEDGVDYMGCDSGFVDSHHQTFSGGRSFGAESHRYAPNQPTHYQPLPAPPAKPADTGEASNG